MMMGKDNENKRDKGEDNVEKKKNQHQAKRKDEKESNVTKLPKKELS